MKFLVCPQCGVSNFFVKNKQGERLNVKVTREFEIVLVDTTKSLVGYNLDEIFCLGCSWHGKKKELKKYLI
jgi:hypothetical protein